MAGAGWTEVAGARPRWAGLRKRENSFALPIEGGTGGAHQGGNCKRTAEDAMTSEGGPCMNTIFVGETENDR